MPSLFPEGTAVTQTIPYPNITEPREALGHEAVTDYLSLEILAVVLEVDVALLQQWCRGNNTGYVPVFHRWKLQAVVAIMSRLRRVYRDKAAGRFLTVIVDERRRTIGEVISDGDRTTFEAVFYRI